MLVFAGHEPRADIAKFKPAGLPTFALFDFQRLARQPDGRELTVALSQGFVQSPDMLKVAFSVCENREQEGFWKPDHEGAMPMAPRELSRSIWRLQTQRAMPRSSVKCSIEMSVPYPAAAIGLPVVWPESSVS